MATMNWQTGTTYVRCERCGTFKAPFSRCQTCVLLDSDKKKDDKKLSDKNKCYTCGLKKNGPCLICNSTYGKGY